MHLDDRIVFLIIGAAIVLLIGVIAAIIKRYKNRPLPMDEMEGHDFEYYCADILKAQGFIEVEVTKGSGDFGADILAEKDGVTYHHILDPSTGMPVQNGLFSVTVTGPSSACCDAMCTAAFVLGRQDGEALIQAFNKARNTEYSIYFNDID